MVVIRNTRWFWQGFCSCFYGITVFGLLRYRRVADLMLIDRRDSNKSAVGLSVCTSNRPCLYGRELEFDVVLLLKRVLLRTQASLVYRGLDLALPNSYEYESGYCGPA